MPVPPTVQVPLQPSWPQPPSSASLPASAPAVPCAGQTSACVHLHVDALELARLLPNLRAEVAQPHAAALTPALTRGARSSFDQQATAPHGKACAAASKDPEKVPVGSPVAESFGLKEEELPLRNQLGLVSQRSKHVLGKVARRGLRYGMVAGALVSALAMMTAPILAPFFVFPAVAVGAAVPLLLLAGVLVGASVEAIARNKHRRQLSVEDVVKLERIYLELKERKRLYGKLTGDDNQAWHKVNTMLEDMSGGFWRALRVILSQQANVRLRCGLYVPGSIFPQTLKML